jgi:hypothetical protein
MKPTLQGGAKFQLIVVYPTDVTFRPNFCLLSIQPAHCIHLSIATLGCEAAASTLAKASYRPTPPVADIRENDSSGAWKLALVCVGVKIGDLIPIGFCYQRHHSQ